MFLLAHTLAPSSGRILKSLLMIDSVKIFERVASQIFINLTVTASFWPELNISTHLLDYHQQTLPDQGIEFITWIICSTHIEFVFILAPELTEVLDSIAWVRCASGNILIGNPHFEIF